MSHGRFLTLEGGEGSGKTTQAQLLRESLENAGVDLIVTREPGGTARAEDIRNLLVSGETGRWQPVSEALLHFAARAEHVALRIRPALERGVWVISDRFSDSTMAYQGVAMDVGWERVEALSAAVLGEFAPDLTLVLDVAETQGLARENQGDGEDRYGNMGPEFHKKIRTAFRDIAERQPDRCKIINAAGSIDEVRELIWTAVAEMFSL